MQLASLDWIIISVFFLIVLGIGFMASKTAGKSTSEFFLGGRGMPWWLLGISMVACTFSCDTPNLVTELVRDNGVSSNWVWWAFLITGMVTVFIYAQLWRRSNVMTDLEFYELRYSGKGAAFLRGFRAIYLGFFFNCLIMGTVSLAAIKIGGVMLGLSPLTTIVGASVFVVIYASLGGIKGVIWSDFFQYGIAMVGAIYAAYVAVNYQDDAIDVGGLGALLSHESVATKLDILPDAGNWMSFIPILLVPLAVQWWAVWYPGAEPGGGGYIAQKMLSAKNEKNAVGATLLFNFMHYAVRPWPWILVALASIVIFPSLADIKAQFPTIDPKYLKSDIAYPAMLAKTLGPGWLGLVVASLIAAYMSTIGTHLNWGSSYVVNDFYQRFVNPKASQKELVTVGRVCTVLLMCFAGFLSLTVLDSARKGLDLMFLSGAGTGAIYLLRWFWWRINAATEIVAMFVATGFAAFLVFGLGGDGTKSLYIESGLVAEKVHQITDPALVKFVQATQTSSAPELAELTELSESLGDTWKSADSGSDEKKAAYEAYVEAYEKKTEFAESLTVTALTKRYVDEKSAEWAGSLASFEAEQNQLNLEKINADRTKREMEPIELEAAELAFAGLVKGDSVFVFHPDVGGLTFTVQLLLMVLVVTVSWILGTLLTKPVAKETLYEFYRIVHPGGPGWAKVLKDAKDENVDLGEQADTAWQMPLQILCVFLGSFAIYGALFSIGCFLYSDYDWAISLGVLSVVCTIAVFRCLAKLRIN